LPEGHEKGRIPVGPRKTTERSGEPLDVKILPLRPKAAVVERMDEAPSVAALCG